MISSCLWGQKGFEFIGSNQLDDILQCNSCIMAASDSSRSRLHTIKMTIYHAAPAGLPHVRALLMSLTARKPGNYSLLESSPLRQSDLFFTHQCILLNFEMDGWRTRTCWTRCMRFVWRMAMTSWERMLFVLPRWWWLAGQSCFKSRDFRLPCFGLEPFSARHWFHLFDNRRSAWAAGHGHSYDSGNQAASAAQLEVPTRPGKTDRLTVCLQVGGSKVGVIESKALQISGTANSKLI